MCRTFFAVTIGGGRTKSWRDERRHNNQYNDNYCRWRWQVHDYNHNHNYDHDHNDNFKRSRTSATDRYGVHSDEGRI